MAVGVKDVEKLLKDIPNKARDILGIMVDVNLRVNVGKELLEIHVEPYQTALPPALKYSAR